MKKIIVIAVIAVMALLLICVVTLSMYGIGSGNEYRPDQDTIVALRGMKVTAEGDRMVFGDARMEKSGGLYILHLKGSPYEIGYQHGVLLRDEVNKGAVRFYADIINGGRDVPFSLKVWLLKKFLEWKVYVPSEKSQPRNILEELKGIADGSGVPYDIIFRANHHTAPLMVMTPVFAKDNVEAFGKQGIKLTSACSSFAALGVNTRDGKIIVGRNTDYLGVTLWPKYQTVLFVTPKEGYAHVKIGTAGMILWNPGMNSEGIVVNPHYMVYDDIDPAGWSIPAFTDAILRKAKNLAEAEEIFRNNPRGVSAGYLIISGKEKNAFAVELSTGKASIRPMEKGRIVMTNMAITEEKRAIDLTVKFNIMEHQPGRYLRLMQLIDANRGKIDPAMVASFMGDHVQYTTGLERATGHIVGVSDNETSVVFSPEDLRFWVADGPAPVCNNPFLGFGLKEALADKSLSATPSILPGYVFKSKGVRQGLNVFMKAFALNEKDPDNTKPAIDLIKSAWKLDPGESHYGRLLTKYQLHAGNYDQALAAIEKVLPLKQSFREKCDTYLLAGMIHDIKGERQKALGFYARIIELSKVKQDDSWFAMNRLLLAYAEQYSKSPFTAKNLSDKSAEIAFVDPYLE
jgi:isopenicillin-N N-acyltransferase-like protein